MDIKFDFETVQNFCEAELNAKLNSSNQFVADSVFESDGKKKLYVDPVKNKYIDFKCKDEKAAGSFIKLVKLMHDFKNDEESAEYIILNYGTSVFKEKFQEHKIKTLQELENERTEAVNNFIHYEKPIWFNTPEKLTREGKIAYNYVLSRKIDKYYLDKLGYVGDARAKFYRRIIIPFFENGIMNYFIGRTIEKNNKLRYLNPSGLDSKAVVFNIDSINEEVIICEGTFDVMSISHDDQAATCLLSADISNKQMEKIFSKKPNTVIYVPDQDATGQAKMEKNISKLLTYCPYCNFEVLIYDIPKPYKDLNELKMATGKDFILKRECRKYSRYDDIFKLIKSI